MATAIQKRKMLTEFRRGQANALNAFCRDNGICARCKNPEKKLTTETLCAACQGYYKQYTANFRAKLVAAPKKPVKKVTLAPAVKAKVAMRIAAIDAAKKPVKKAVAKKGKKK